MRRQQLTEAQITALLDPPTDQRELVCHYTLSAADLEAIRRCRGDHNRLGHAVMLCYLRYPGRPLKAGERPPRPLLLFIAEQIDALPESIEDYLATERNRQRHVAELQDRLGFRPFGTRPAADLAGWLLPHAIENNRLVHLAGLGVEECRRRRIVVPSPKRARAALRPSRHRNHPVEHAVSRARRCRSAQTKDVPDQLLAHLSSLGWEHVNLTGDYIWSAERPVTERRDGFRPLRAAPDTARQGRLSSWFVRLCVKSGRFVTSVLDASTRSSVPIAAGRCSPTRRAARRPRRVRPR